MPPPPEKPEAVRARTNVILSFWAVILLLGLPTWWKTTSIARAALPTTEMLSSEHIKPPYVVTVRAAAPQIPCEYARRIISDTQSTLDQRNEFDAFEIKVELVHFGTDHTGSAVEQQNECGVPVVAGGEAASALDIEFVEGDSYELQVLSSAHTSKVMFTKKDVESLGTNLAESLKSIFADEQTAVAYQYYTRGDTSEALESYVQSLPGEKVQKVERAAALAFKAAPNYHLTFSLFTASGAPSSWDIDSSLKHYVHPLIHSFEPAAKISTTSQVQMYSAFSSSVQPFEAVDEEGWSLREQDLTAFVNAAEWPLPPSIGFGPTINFILYVPEKHQLPLRIENGKGVSWIVPQWGGIAILNPKLITNNDTQTQHITPHLDSEMLQSAFETFRSQLLTLMGVPALSELPLSLRLKSFQRLSGLSMYLRTTSNLGSLARLSQRLSSIPIPHRVVELVDQATKSLLTYRQDRSLAPVRTALKTSEKAFFDKSMVGQVYFPDEHKIAVYLPLLGPIGVPLVVALLREIKQLMNRK